MDEMSTGLSFEEVGIASALSRRVLSVPLNQRPYAWGEEEVSQLLDDLFRAFDKGEPIYFLGAIVLTQGPNRQWEVADGQQRLATTAIIIAAIRDYLLDLGDEMGANKFQAEFLLDYDPRKKDSTSKLILNHQDHDFFVENILKAPKSRVGFVGQLFGSHDQLKKAAALARVHVRKIFAGIAERDRPERLYDWVDYLKDSAKVIVIMVPGKIGNAFKMFETLNARGMEASKTDILKNHLFGLAPMRGADIHARWISMLSTIESAGEDDLLVTFIRHFWITQHGPTTDRELGQRIEEVVRTERNAVDMVMALDAYATDYVALLAPRDSPRWNEFSRPTRDAIHTITRELGGEQIRPLLLAVARSFPKPEAEKAFKLMVSWTVRFLVVGGGGGGVMDKAYGQRAMEVTRGGVKTAKQLAASMAEVIPNDVRFREAFKSANVRKSKLARYYLRALELHVTDEKFPQFVPNDDTAAVNLEHVLPVTVGDEWKIDPDVAELYHKRLGNMVLMSSKQNVALANSSFKVKRPYLGDSPYLLTRDVAEQRKWGPEEIEARQSHLADLAPRVWPI